MNRGTGKFGQGWWVRVLGGRDVGMQDKGS